MKTIEHWVDGSSWAGTSTRTGEVADPVRGMTSAHVALASAEDVGHVAARARAAADRWEISSLGERAEVLFSYRELIKRHRSELAEIVSSEHGKVHADALGEVQRGLEVVDFACGIPHLMKGGFSSRVSASVDSYSIYQPMGVVAGITPFNFPVMVPMWMHPLAIACGNAFILKPSEKDPSASVRMAELWSEAGLPDGVFNVVHGDVTAVEAILDHPDVAGVSFVGSTPVARAVYERGTRAGKRVQALGGAKNHLVALPDADIDDTADAAVSAAFGSAGERCMSISVLVAVGSVADELVTAIAERAEAIEVGASDAPGVEMGPLVTAAHLERVAGLVDSGVEDGAKLVVDGRGLQVEGAADGFWLGPCLFDHVEPDMEIYRQEIFGPVLCVVRVETFDAAVELINSGPYGNGTAIFTNDGGAAQRFEREIEVGMVGVNVPIPVPMAYYSFGGWKDSLFGDTHVHGEEGIHFYTRRKAVSRRWTEPQRRGVDLGFPTNT